MESELIDLSGYIYYKHNTAVHRCVNVSHQLIENHLIIVILERSMVKATARMMIPP